MVRKCQAENKIDLQPVGAVVKLKSDKQLKFPVPLNGALGDSLLVRKNPAVSLFGTGPSYGYHLKVMGWMEYGGGRAFI